MTREEMEMRKLVRESDVIDKTNGTELARAFNHLWNQYIEQEPCEDVPDINDGKIYKCSCGYGWDKSKVFRHHFCPNCGKPVKGTMPYVPASKIENAPPVAPQPKIGQWILTPRDKYIDINCSVCGNTRIKDYSYGYSIDELNLDEANDFLSKARINYCEHCGAKMKGVRKYDSKRFT